MKKISIAPRLQFNTGWINKIMNTNSYQFQLTKLTHLLNGSFEEETSSCPSVCRMITLNVSSLAPVLTFFLEFHNLRVPSVGKIKFFGLFRSIFPPKRLVLFHISTGSGAEIYVWVIWTKVYVEGKYILAPILVILEALICPSFW